MNDYFQKLNFSIPCYNEIQLKGEAHTVYPGLIYCHIADSRVKQQLHDLSPIPTEHISYMEITNDLLPHIDHDGEVVLNYYISTGDAKTVFYTAAKNYSNIINNSRVYNPKDCVFQTSFMATSNSTFLLNVGKIHSVQSIKSKRTGIVFRFKDYKYDEVLDKLQNLWC